MSNTYRITKVSPCPECDGDGWILNPAWEQYYDELGHKGAYSQEDHEAWFSNHGYEQIPDEAWFSNHGYEQIPDEEEPCWVCEGTGRITTETSLHEALEDIGVFRVHQHIDERILDLESDIKAIPHLMDRICKISNASQINDQMIINLTKEIRGLKALFDEIQEFTTRIDAKAERHTLEIEGMDADIETLVGMGIDATLQNLKSRLEDAEGCIDELVYLHGGE